MNITTVGNLKELLNRRTIFFIGECMMNEQKTTSVKQVAESKLSFYSDEDKRLQQMCRRMMTESPEKIPGKVSKN